MSHALPLTRNTRVDRLLEIARKYGHTVDPSSVAADCWVIRAVPDHGVTLTVYAADNHSARVYLDAPWDRDWMLITQKRAVHLLTEGL